MSRPKVVVSVALTLRHQRRGMCRLLRAALRSLITVLADVCSFGGRPLWPTADGPPDPQPCERCGGRRVYELQLMTPLIPALAESADWLAEAGSGGGAELLQAPDSWEWLTVCVASCAASCGDGGQATAVAEQVVLVNEE